VARTIASGSHHVTLGPFIGDGYTLEGTTLRCGFIIINLNFFVD